jgi:hypothetical protein
LASSIGDYLEEGDEAFLLSFDDDDSFWNATTGYYDGEAELAFSLSSDNEDLNHEASLPLNFFPGGRPGTHPAPVYSAPSHPFDSFAAVTTSNALVPSQVQFSKLKGATIGIGDEVSVADKKVSDVADSSIYTAVSVLAADKDSDNDVSEAFVLADKTVSEGIYTGIGPWTCLDPFHTKPEEEIIFESQDSEDSTPGESLQSVAPVQACKKAKCIDSQPCAFSNQRDLSTITTSKADSPPISLCLPVKALFHASPSEQPPFCDNFFVLGIWSPSWRYQANQRAYIGSRKSSLRWATALIHKLLLVAWDLWQFRNHYYFTQQLAYVS